MRCLVPVVLAIAVLGAVSPGLAQRRRRAEPRDVLQTLALQEEVFAQQRGTLQWELVTSVRTEDEEPVWLGRIGMELGVATGLEVQGDLALESGLESGATGLAAPSLGVVWGVVDEPMLGVTVLARARFPARSGLDEHVFAYDAEVHGHSAISFVHVQAMIGVEVQHGDDLRVQRAQDARVDVQAAVAAWVHAGEVALVLEAAAEPSPGDIEWKVGPTLLVRVLEPLVIQAHGSAELGGDEVLYSGLIGATMQAEMFR